jgi:hypothetical protein
LGTISSNWAAGERSSPTSTAKASWPCCPQVRSTLARIPWVRAPCQVRLPPQTFRAITTPRKARSPALLVASRAVAVQKGEQMESLVPEVLGQLRVGLRAIGQCQQPFQTRFQPPGGRPQPVQADEALLVAVAQGERFLRTWSGKAERSARKLVFVHPLCHHVQQRLREAQPFCLREVEADADWA